MVDIQPASNAMWDGFAKFKPPRKYEPFLKSRSPRIYRYASFSANNLNINRAPRE